VSSPCCQAGTNEASDTTDQSHRTVIVGVISLAAIVTAPLVPQAAGTVPQAAMAAPGE
jgi:hypothetical protein